MISAGDAGTGWPVSRQAAAIRAGMSPGAAKRGSSGSIDAAPAGNCAGGGDELGSAVVGAPWRGPPAGTPRATTAPSRS